MNDSTSEPTSHRPRKRRHSLADAWLRSVVERRWWATTFTRQGMMDALRNLAWVGPLTVLIWVYAEREQVDTQQYPDVPVQIVGNNLAITPDYATISIKLKGPQDGRERVEAALGKPGLKIDIGSTTARGNQSINVMDHIQNLPLFSANGVSVTEVTPAEIETRVDDIIDQSIPVQSPPSVTNLENTTHYEPSVVKAHGPKSEINSHLKQGDLIAYADLQSVETLTPGHHEQTVDVYIASKDTSITLDPPTVKAFLDVRSKDVTKVIPSMVIWITAPENVFNDYDISEVPVTVPNTTVTGPPDEVESLDKTPPTAVLRITSDDYEHEQPKQLSYDLPPGVTVSKADQARTFPFKLTKRQKTD